jgi:hypothetical protein
MITHDTRRSLSRGKNPVPSPWQATGVDGTLRYALRLESSGNWRLTFSEVVQPQGPTLCDLHVAVA